MRISLHRVSVILGAFALLAQVNVFAQNQSPAHPTGLNFLDANQYDLLPKAQAPVSGELPDSATLEDLFPRAQNQGQSNACAAFAVTSNKSYRAYLASGRRGSPDDYLQSPGFPTVLPLKGAAAHKRRLAEAAHTSQMNSNSFRR